MTIYETILVEAASIVFVVAVGAFLWFTWIMRDER